MGPFTNVLFGASNGAFLDGDQVALKILPNTKCCTTGILSKTSPSYNFNNPEETFDQLFKWEMSLSMGDDSKKGTFCLICCMKCMQEK
mmetsp:Transcript_40464/g.74054  ORF Transcript_40464/g.74054 Transcript_40464/m.74054 type:complete len:88 (-) Transcript_40464:750-1013(-)